MIAHRTFGPPVGRRAGRTAGAVPNVMTFCGLALPSLPDAISSERGRPSLLLFERCCIFAGATCRAATTTTSGRTTCSPHATTKPHQYLPGPAAARYMWTRTGLRITVDAFVACWLACWFTTVIVLLTMCVPPPAITSCIPLFSFCVLLYYNYTCLPSLL